MKIVTISDTHAKHKNLNLPQGDLIIHCGDFSDGSLFNVTQFVEWYSKLPFKYKILIAGNHDLAVAEMGYKHFFELCKQFDIIYLENSVTKIDGIKFFGSPYTIRFNNWAFMRTEEELEKIWKNIPLDTDILITHTPAYSIGDLTKDNIHAGSKTLLNRIKQLKNLKYHCFGHIHESYGIYNCDNYTAINASILDENYELTHTPFIFEF
jgi:Icc-related predicted phosphoesterase